MGEWYSFYHQYYDAANPVNILTVGESDLDGRFRARRDDPVYSCLEYVTGGRGILETPDGARTVGTGDFYVLYKGVPHAYRTDGDHWEKIWVEFDGTLLDAMMAAFLPEKPTVVHCPEAEEDIRQIIGWAKANTDYPILCTEAAPVILRILQKLHAASGRNGGQAEEIRAWLDRHICEQISLEDVTRDFFYSRNHIISVFSAAYGMTPYQYYIEKRLQLIRSYLADTDLPVKEIAAALCFDDAKYLSTFFRRRTGMTPVAYRRSIRNGGGTSRRDGD